VTYERNALGLWVPERLAARGPLVRGRVMAHLDGRLVAAGENVFTLAGYGRIAAWLASGVAAGVASTVASPTFIAVGTGSGTPANTDTFMFQEIARKAITGYSVQATYTAQLTVTFSQSEANGSITEIGLCDAGGYPINANGTATSYTSTTLTDTGANWTTNQWAGGWLYIISATTGAGQRTQIVSNTATVLTFNAITLPTGTVTYRVAPANYLFAHYGVALTKTNANQLLVTWQLVLPSS
jgi:hypothetical protein